MSIIQHPYWSINIKKSAECELDRAYYTRHGSQYIAYDVCCKKCGWVVDIHEPHYKTRGGQGPCYFYHYSCYDKKRICRSYIGDY